MASPGIHVGLIVDGNDLQTNELMDAVHDYLRRVHGESADLPSITAWDFVEIQRELNAKGSQLEITQLFTASSISTPWWTRPTARTSWESQKRPILPNSVEYEPSVKAAKPLIPPPVRDELIKLCNEDPRRIEWSPASSVNPSKAASQEQEL